MRPLKVWITQSDTCMGPLVLPVIGEDTHPHSHRERGMCCAVCRCSRKTPRTVMYFPLLESQLFSGRNVLSVEVVTQSDEEERTPDREQ